MMMVVVVLVVAVMAVRVTVVVLIVLVRVLLVVMAVLVVVVVEVVLVVLRVIVVVWVVVIVLIGVVVVLVVTFDQPHFQQLPYILSYVITLKIESDNDPLNWAVLRLAVKQLLPSETRWGWGGRERRMFEGRSRTVNVKDVLPLSFFFFYRCK